MDRARAVQPARQRRIGQQVDIGARAAGAGGIAGAMARLHRQMVAHASGKHIRGGGGVGQGQRGTVEAADGKLRRHIAERRQHGNHPHDAQGLDAGAGRSVGASIIQWPCPVFVTRAATASSTKSE